MASAAILPAPVLAANVAYVQPWELEGGDATIIMRGIFDANVKLDQILELLKEDDGEEEEEDWSPES
jgi:hypothetical protein